jgi:GT2 family glycosyltransferase
MNPVLILTHNCLELTKKCVASVRKQNIETSIWIVDNGSTDGTEDYLLGNRKEISSTRFGDNRGVSYGWNAGLRRLFELTETEHVLVLNNDTILPSNFYRDLLSYEVPFVTGTETREMTDIGPLVSHERNPLGLGPDFSCFLIRREAWEKIGPFDESMKIWCSDCDYDVRARKLGMPLMRANVIYYHERSSTIRKASQEEREEYAKIGDSDRAAFKAKYGCVPGSPEYAELFPEFIIRNPPEE